MELFVDSLLRQPSSLSPTASARRLSGQLVVENHRSANEVDEEDPALEIPCFDSATTVSLNLGFFGIVMPPAGVFSRLTELTLISVWFHGPPELIGDAPVANISAPQLVSLFWKDSYDPSSVLFGNMEQPQSLILTASNFHVYGPHDFWLNLSCLRLLEQFQAIHKLHLGLIYPKSIGNFQYLMEDLRKFPTLEALAVMMCTSLTKFALVQGPENDLQAQYTCQSSCVCDEPTNWKTKELTLNQLHAVLIIDMKGTDHEVAFLKRLFSWATALKSVKITASKAKEVHEKVLSLAKPETCVTLAAK
ncbi:hypothetical protein EJB05_13924, partial [Eragrostis curvula]